MLSLREWTATIHPGHRLRVVSGGVYWRVLSVQCDPLTITLGQPHNESITHVATEDNGWLQGLRQLQDDEPCYRGEPFRTPDPPAPPKQPTVAEWLASLTFDQDINIGTPTHYKVVTTGKNWLQIRNVQTGRMRKIRGWHEVNGLMNRPPYRPRQTTPPPPPPSLPQRAPREAVCYRLYDRQGQLLYVGYSINPTERMKSHKDTQPWWAEVNRILPTWYSTEQEAAAAEHDAILCEFPLYNARGVTHPYISPVRRTG